MSPKPEVLAWLFLVRGTPPSCGHQFAKDDATDTGHSTTVRIEDVAVAAILSRDVLWIFGRVHVRGISPVFNRGSFQVGVLENCVLGYSAFYPTKCTHPNNRGNLKEFAS